MSTLIRLRKGLNIRLAGKAEKILLPEVAVTRFGVRFADFPGLVARLEVQEGDKVMCGSVLFHDKAFLRLEELCATGIRRVVAAGRGILAVRKTCLYAAGGYRAEDRKGRFGVTAPLQPYLREQVKEKLLSSGCGCSEAAPYQSWPGPGLSEDIFIRPFDTPPRLLLISTL